MYTHCEWHYVWFECTVLLALTDYASVTVRSYDSNIGEQIQRSCNQYVSHSRGRNVWCAICGAYSYLNLVFASSMIPLTKLMSFKFHPVLRNTQTSNSSQRECLSVYTLTMCIKILLPLVFVIIVLLFWVCGGLKPDIHPDVFSVSLLNRTEGENENEKSISKDRNRDLAYQLTTTGKTESAWEQFFFFSFFAI